MESEDFKTWLRVWIVSWLILQLSNANFGEEGVHDTEEMTEANSAIDDDTLNLVELSQMGSIQSFIPEHSVN